MDELSWGKKERAKDEEKGKNQNWKIVGWKKSRRESIRVQ